MVYGEVVGLMNGELVMAGILDIQVYQVYKLRRQWMSPVQTAGALLQISCPTVRSWMPIWQWESSARTICTYKINLICAVYSTTVELAHPNKTSGWRCILVFVTFAAETSQMNRTPCKFESNQFAYWIDYSQLYCLQPLLTVTNVFGLEDTRVSLLSGINYTVSSLSYITQAYTVNMLPLLRRQTSMPNLLLL